MKQHQLERRAFERMTDAPAWTEQERSKFQQRLRNLQNDIERMIIEQMLKPAQENQEQR